ncbi:MAG: 2OG-Fe(II) oxygenase [Thermoanaerobaculia bacterium]
MSRRVGRLAWVALAALLAAACGQTGPVDDGAGATAGSAVLFDSRVVAHQVRAVREGPARWALAFWFNDAPHQPWTPTLPELTLTDALLPIAAPPLADDVVLFHQLSDADPAGEITVLTLPSPRPQLRIGCVATVYRGGSGLDAWCEHHLSLGMDHIVVIFDHLEEPDETAADERLRARYPRNRLTIWSGAETARRWPDDARSSPLRGFASGSSSHAVACRQNPSAEAFRKKYLDVAASPPPETRLFAPSPEEAAASFRSNPRRGADEHLASSGAPPVNGSTARWGSPPRRPPRPAARD